MVASLANRFRVQSSFIPPSRNEAMRLLGDWTVCFLPSGCRDGRSLIRTFKSLINSNKSHNIPVAVISGMRPKELRLDPC